MSVRWIFKRNFERNISSIGRVFDKFAPGWRTVVDLNSSKASARQKLFEYWRDQVAQLCTDTANNVRLIIGGNNQRLYWLLLAAKHELARKFWGVATNVEKQGKLL